jgi:hypothetical protein
LSAPRIFLLESETHRQGKIDRYLPATITAMPLRIAQTIAACSSDKCAGG